MTLYFGKTLEDLVASCTNNEYIEKAGALYYLMKEDGAEVNDGDMDKDWAAAIAAVNRNRYLLPRDLSVAVKSCITFTYSHCDPLPHLRDFKRRTLTTAFRVDQYLRFTSTDTNWNTGELVMNPADCDAFIKVYNDLDVSEETDASVLLLAFTLKNIVHVCDTRDPWGMLMKWRTKRGAQLCMFKDNWMIVFQKDGPSEIVHLPVVVPHSLVDDFNRGAPVPFEKFYSAEEALKLLERYYGTENFSPFIKLFKDGKLSRSAVLP